MTGTRPPAPTDASSVVMKKSPKTTIHQIGVALRFQVHQAETALMISITTPSTTPINFASDSQLGMMTSLPLSVQLKVTGWDSPRIPNATTASTANTAREMGAFQLRGASVIDGALGSTSAFAVVICLPLLSCGSLRFANGW